MKPVFTKASSDQAKKFLSPMFMAVVFVSILAMPGMAMAQEATDRVEEFFGNLNSLLNIASIAVVTIAVIFAGYQIAFAHKRISDVAPVLIGGFLIGAALHANPAEAIGLDGALAALAAQPFGPYLLGLVAAGLAAYGLFALVEARYRRMVIC